eukprot:6897421-Alexandrium_andersonii.AAC.1
MSASLVGSEMCIRDRFPAMCDCDDNPARDCDYRLSRGYRSRRAPTAAQICLLYTSDAADDM